MFLKRVIGLIILFLLVSILTTYQMNTSYGFRRHMEKNYPFVANITTLSDLTKSGFESSDNFKLMLMAKIRYHKFKTLILIALLGLGLYRYSLRLKKKGEKNKLYNILDNLNLIYRETDKEGNILREEVPTVSFDTESQSVMIKGLNDKVIKKAIDYSQGLLIDLKSIGMIDMDEGVADTTGRPGEIKIQLLTRELLGQSEINSFLKSIKMYAETDVGGKKIIRYPKFLEDGDDLIVDGQDVPVSLQTLKYNLDKISITFNKDLIQIIQEDKNKYRLLSKKEAKVLFPSGTDISDDYNLFKTTIIDVMREKFEKTREIYWYLGACRDSLFKLDNQELIISCDQINARMEVGGAGSGKSETLKLWGTALHHAYGHNVESFYANGSQASTFDVFTKRYSPMGVESAKPVESAKEQDKLNPLLSILKYVQSKANKRAVTFKSIGIDLNISCEKVSDYRKIVENLHADPNTSQELKDKYPLLMTEIFIFIDEFAAISVYLDYEGKSEIDGSPARYLHKMLAENRKYGVRVVLASQECRAKSIPSRLLTNIPAGVVMRISEKDFNYMTTQNFDFGGFNPLKFPMGQGMFYNSFIRCQSSGSYQIPIIEYYLGRDAIKVIEQSDYSFPLDKKMEYDLEMLSLTENDRDFVKIANFTLQKVVEQAFFQREGWLVTEKLNPDNFLINTYAEKIIDGSLIKLKVVFTRVEDVSMENFFDRIDREASSKVDTTLYFILGKTDPRKFSEVSDKLIKDSPCIVLSSNEYSMELSKAYDYLNNNDSTPVFDTLLTQIESQKQLRIEAILKETYKGVDAKKQRICLNKLQEIINNPNAEEKGRLFEDFILLIERSLNFDTVKGIELSLENHVDFKFNKNNRNEGGLDLFRWTNREEKRGIGFQLKNQPSKALNVEIVDKIGKTIKLYSALGITFEKFVLISTGPITDQAKKEALACGYYVYGYDDLEKYFAVQEKSFFLTMQEDRNVKMSNGLFSKEEMEEIYNASVDEDDKKRRDAIKSDPDHKEVLTMFKSLIKQKREDKEGSQSNLKKLDGSDSVKVKSEVANQAAKPQIKEQFDDFDFEQVTSEELITETQNSETIEVEASESLEILSSMDLIADIKYKVSRGYIDWIPVNDWEFYKKLPSLAERKTIAKVFDYVKIEESDRVSVFIVKNERASRKYGVEVLKAITAAQKVFKTRKMKISKIEIHYVGEIDRVAIGQKVKYFQH